MKHIESKNKRTKRTKLIKTNLLINNNLFFPKGIYYEDLGVMPAIAIYANKIEYVEEAFYGYFQRANSIMNQPKYNKKFEHIFISLENLTNIFKNENAYDNQCRKPNNYQSLSSKISLKQVPLFLFISWFFPNH